MTRALTRPPAVVVCDVNETLSDMGALTVRLEEVGAPGDLLPLWFAATLRDGFALTAAGAYADFNSIAIPALVNLIEKLPGLRRPPAEAAEHVVAGLSELALHADVAPGLRALHEAGVRIVTLSNGAADVAEKLLARAGLRDLVEQCLSVAGAGRWKPDAAAYRYAARRCAADPAQLALVAVHPWDIDGASRAGLRTAWIARSGGSFPAYLRRPDAQARNLPELAAALLGSG